MRKVQGVGLLLMLFSVSGCGDRMVGWPLVEATDTGVGHDETVPTVVSTAPADLDVAVPLDVAVEATFSERMDRTTIGEGTLLLRDASATLVGGVVYYDSDTFTASLVPGSQLVAGAAYTATVTTGATDRSGNPLAADYVWTFTTDDSGLDVTPPTVILTDPLDLATGVSLGAQVEVTFSEAMAPLTVSGSSLDVALADGTLVPGAVYYNVPTHLATFVPDAPFAPDEVYTGSVTTAVTDLAGNALAVDYVWSFTTDDSSIDVTPPTVIDTDPADLQVGVALDSVVAITFSEAMDSLSLDGSTVELFAPDSTAVLGTVYYDAMAHIATFIPDSDLDAGSTYEGIVTTGVEDLAGNAMTLDYVWSFTTDSSSIDVTPPTVIDTDPADLQVGVALDSVVAITFSEAMDSLSVDGSTVELFAPDASLVAGTVYYDAMAHIATFVPDADLDAGSTYEGIVTTGVEDLAGNAMTLDYVWSFTTDSSSIDVTPPTIITVDPLNLSVDVAVGTLVTATFSEPMDPLTFDSTTFELVAPDLSIVPATVFYDVPTWTATLVPDEVLLSESTYSVTVSSGVTDVSGMSMVSDYSWSFTTADVTAPMVILTMPEDVAVDVAVDTTVEFTFDEDMDELTITTANFDVVAPDGSTVAGVLTYDPLTRVGTFVPDVDLFDGETYIATVTTGATDVAGNPLEYDYSWSFTTLSDVWVLEPVNLGSLTTFVAVAGAGLTNSNSGGITSLGGDVGLSPTGTCLGDGAPCTLTNPVITGTLYVMDATAALAKTDLTVAYLDAMSRPPGTLENDITGMTLAPGVYTSSSTMSIAVGGTVTLDGQGDGNSVWIFQVGSSLTVNNSAQVLLINGAKAENVFWAVFASSTIGTNVNFQGSVLAGASNSVETGSTVVGRLLCTTGAITLLSDTIILP